MSYISVAEAKAWLGIDLGNTASDTIIGDLIAVVDEAIDAWCECTFTGPVTVTNELHDARRQDAIVPKNWPLIAVTQIVLGVDSDGTGGMVMPTSEYVYDDVSIRLIRTLLPQQHGYVRLDYTWGFASVPMRVKQAAKIGVEGYFRARARQSVGITSRAKEGESINYGKAWSEEAGLPKEAVGLLKQFRMMEFPSGPGAGMATRNN